MLKKIIQFIQLLDKKWHSFLQDRTYIFNKFTNMFCRSERLWSLEWVHTDIVITPMCPVVEALMPILQRLQWTKSHGPECIEVWTMWVHRHQHRPSWTPSWPKLTASSYWNSSTLIDEDCKCTSQTQGQVIWAVTHRPVRCIRAGLWSDCRLWLYSGCTLLMTVCDVIPCKPSIISQWVGLNHRVFTNARQ